MATQRQLAERSGLGLRTISDLERGARDNYAPDTLAAVEAALGWPPGAVRDLIELGVGPQHSDADLDALASMWPRLSPEARPIVVRVARALIEPRAAEQPSVVVDQGAARPGRRP